MSRNCLIFMVPLAMLCASSDVRAQAKKKQPELTIPDPETVTLTTKDGIALRCTYYAGGFVERVLDKEKGTTKVEKKPGKETIPVIILHGWDGRRTELDGLASYLQRQGHAVMVPDLRAHGDSSSPKQPNGRDLERDRMRSTDMNYMLHDVDAAKKFLLDKNNKEEVNIEQLCVIGAGFGATLAVNWSAHDWSRTQLPAFKQGQDVKALVLISPEQSFKGFSLTNALRHPIVQKALSILVIYGEQQRSSASDATSLFTRLEKYRDKQPENLAERDLVKFELPTTLQSTDLLRARNLPALPIIAGFIASRLENDKFPWSDRTNPLAE